MREVWRLSAVSELACLVKTMRMPRERLSRCPYRAEHMGRNPETWVGNRIKTMCTVNFEQKRSLAWHT